MPRDGAKTLSEVRVPVLSIVCAPCGRRERYDVERLQREYGWDAKLTDLLAALVADCPKRGAPRESWLRLSGQISANDKWRPAGFAVSAALGLDEGRA